MEEEFNVESSGQEQEEAPKIIFEGAGKNIRPLQRKAKLMNDEDYLRDRVDAQIEWYNNKSKFNQLSYKRLKKIEFYISASVPVVISLSTMSWVTEVRIPNTTFGLDTVLQISAAIAGVIVVIVGKLQEMEEYFTLWKQYRLTCEALQHERLLYLTRAEPYDELDAFPRFVEKIEAILNNEAQKWRQVRQDKKEEQPPKEEKQQAQNSEQQ